MNKKLITLKPLTPYFFGGENTFEDGKINYYARSNYLPQQSTLLGMLRYELLFQNDLIGKDPIINDWKSLIGENSFGNINGKFVEKFGAIENISPIFISNGTDHFTTQALDWSFYELDNGVRINNCSIKGKKVAPVIVDFEKTSNELTIYNEQDVSVPKLRVSNTSYDPKFGLVSLWVNSNGNTLKVWDYKNPLEFDSTIGYGNGFFIKHEQVGINRKLKKNRNDQGDFYKQVLYKLTDNFRFAFFADFDLPSGKTFESRIITMGGERSVFEMSVDDAAGESFDTFFNLRTFVKGHSRNHKVFILTSNCYCDDSVIKNCVFSINETENFQNIITNQNTVVNYSEFARGKLTKSGENLTLLKRGSVLFPQSGKADLIRTALTNKAFSKIGYNKFIEIN